MPKNLMQLIGLPVSNIAEAMGHISEVH